MSKGPLMPEFAANEAGTTHEAGTDQTTTPAGRASQGDDPLLVYIDDATGERTELSATELAGWAARTAGLLREGCGLHAGDRVGIMLPPHWQTAAVLLGAWAAGLSVSIRLKATAGLPTLGPGADEPLDAVFVTRTRLDDWLDDVPEAHHRFVLDLALPGSTPTEPPEGYRDYLAEALRYPSDPEGYSGVRANDPASVDGTTYREWGSLGHGMAELLDLRPGDRLMVDADEHEHPAKWLLSPLAAGASMVLCANLDPARVTARVAAERVTRVM